MTSFETHSLNFLPIKNCHFCCCGVEVSPNGIHGLNKNVSKYFRHSELCNHRVFSWMMVNSQTVLLWYLGLRVNHSFGTLLVWRRCFLRMILWHTQHFKLHPLTKNFFSHPALQRFMHYGDDSSNSSVLFNIFFRVI